MSRQTRNVQTPVRFRGVPASMTGVIPEGVDAAAEIMLVLRRGDKDGASKTPRSDDFAVEVDFDPRVLRVMLPPEVPPGSYEAVLTVAGSERPAQVDVDAEPQLRMFPEQLRIAAKAGETVTKTVSIVNAGNVTATLRKAQAFGVMMAGGIERALRLAYVESTPTDRRRIDILADGLAAAHGGLVKIRLREGAGDLAPGELRTLELEIDLPKSLAPASEYTGNWEMPGLVYPVTLAIAGSKRGEDDPDREPDVPVVN